MYVHIFIHSSVDGHLACFLVPVLVNSVAINIEKHVSFWFSLDICQGVGLWDHIFYMNFYI